MPLLYLAKVNLNSNIFEVYKRELDIRNVSGLIYEKFSTEDNYMSRSKERYTDYLGNETVFIRESFYSFQEIEKLGDGIVTGKLVRRFNKPSEKLDKVTNKMITFYVEEAVSIYFYYDVYKEMIAFCERQSFGYTQFTTAFTQLLNKCAIPYEFEIFLQKDEAVLEEKLKSLKTVQKVHATLIPPNSNEEGLEELAEELQYMKECMDANATKLHLEYSSSNLNMDSKIMSDIKKAVLNGYGDINATGTNHSGRSQIIKSSKDAAFTIHIQDNINKEDFKEESRNLILRFLSRNYIKLTRRTEV